MKNIIMAIFIFGFSVSPSESVPASKLKEICFTLEKRIGKKTSYSTSDALDIQACTWYIAGILDEKTWQNNPCSWHINSLELSTFQIVLVVNKYLRKMKLCLKQ